MYGEMQNHHSEILKVPCEAFVKFSKREIPYAGCNGKILLWSTATVFCRAIGKTVTRCRRVTVLRFPTCNRAEPCPLSGVKQTSLCAWPPAEFSIKMCNGMKPLECFLLDLLGSRGCDGTLNQSAGQPKRDFAKRPRKSVVTVQ